MLIESRDQGTGVSVGGSEGTDPYRSVIWALCGGALLGALLTAVAGALLGNQVLLDGAVTSGICASILASTGIARSGGPGWALAPLAAGGPDPAVDFAPPPPSAFPRADLLTRVGETARRLIAVLRRMGHDVVAAEAAGIAAMVASIAISLVGPDSSRPALVLAVVVAVGCLGIAALSATAVRYLVSADPTAFGEAAALARAARVIAWVMAAAALSIVLSWFAQLAALRVMHVAILAVNLGLGFELATAARRSDAGSGRQPLDLVTLGVVGSRTNVFGSVLDAAESQLGIDLRSTWALTVVRRSIEPLAIALVAAGWLSTMFTVVGLDEQGLVERFGVPVVGPTLGPGLHLHWPWPIDRVTRVSAQRVKVLTVGHEGEERPGPENVLWALQHAANEYTLLLGNGRDLITIDAAIQFHITDVRAWHYSTRNPEDALRAIAYRAVMRNTVSKTLADALSENVVTTTARMRQMVQQEADALHLGVDILGFTVGGMHPPVAVAADYQAVVSAELGRVTAVVDAQASRNRLLPAAEQAVFAGAAAARAEGAEAEARAAGEAWAFRTVETQYRASPQEFMFRRRLETLEQALTKRHFVLVDSRFQRDGGQLWLTTTP
jgi:regulator of protease activity HflC (stomatin/prohibitin superfamily)